MNKKTFRLFRCPLRIAWGTHSYACGLQVYRHQLGWLEVSICLPYRRQRAVFLDITIG